MSADDYVYIWKSRNGKYLGFGRFASVRYEHGAPHQNELPFFCADTLEKAIQLAQDAGSEYGYVFGNLSEDEVVDPKSTSVIDTTQV